MENTSSMLAIRSALLVTMRETDIYCRLDLINTQILEMVYRLLVRNVWLLLRGSTIGLMVGIKAIKKEEKRG